MKGAARWDPVEVLDLAGQLVGPIGCPYMVQRLRQRRQATVAEPCGAQASLYLFQDPYGYRAYCEEGHVCVLSKHSIPGLYPRKNPTD